MKTQDHGKKNSQISITRKQATQSKKWAKDLNTLPKEISLVIRQIQIETKMRYE